jgi:hypothetical protein
MPSLSFNELIYKSITAKDLDYKVLSVQSSGSIIVYTYALNYNGHDGADPVSPIVVANTDTISFNISGFTHGGTNKVYYIAGSEANEQIYIRSDGRVRFVDAANEIRQVTGLTQLFDGGSHSIEMQLSPTNFELFVDGNSVGNVAGNLASTNTFTTLFRRSSSITPEDSVGVVYNVTFGTVASYPLQDDTAGNTNLVDAISRNNLTLVSPDLSLANFIEVPLVGDQ